MNMMTDGERELVQMEPRDDLSEFPRSSISQPAMYITEYFQGVVEQVKE